MEIRASLIFDNLKSRFSVKSFGKRKEIPLLRPVFYNKSCTIEKNRIYVVRPEMIPPKNLLDSTMLLICAEGEPSLAYQHGNTPVFVVSDAAITDVLNEVLAIFERYENWEKALNNILATNADLSEMVQITAPLLVNDITIVDKELRVIAAANYLRNPEGLPERVENVALEGVIPLDIANWIREFYAENVRKRGGFFSTEGCYCVNLYLRQEFWGSISLFPRLTPLRESDSYVFDILADAVLQALTLRAVNDNPKICELEQITRNLMDGVEVSFERMQTYEDSRRNRMSQCFLALSILPPEYLREMSVDYVCQTMRDRYPNLVIFQYENYLLGMKDFSCCEMGYESFIELLRQDMDEFGLKVGISNRFSHLRHLRSYYQQAVCALEYGSSRQQEQHLYFFDQYAFPYMMINSSGAFRAKYLCPAGLRALQEYNRGSEVDYWNTLRCYLDLERNIAHTAKALGIHRNTMIQRVERLQHILDMDLDEPENRLWLRMAMWLVDEEAAGC